MIMMPINPFLENTQNIHLKAHSNAFGIHGHTLTGRFKSDNDQRHSLIPNIFQKDLILRNTRNAVQKKGKMKQRSLRKSNPWNSRKCISLIISEKILMIVMQNLILKKSNQNSKNLCNSHSLIITFEIPHFWGIFSFKKSVLE